MFKIEDVAYLIFDTRIYLERLMESTITLAGHFSVRESNLVATEYKPETFLCELTR
jgi:hypothetical protein